LINNLQEFSKNEIDWRGERKNYEDKLIDNKIPASLVPLKIMFDRHAMHKENKDMVKPNEYMEINIGSPSNAKIVKIGKGTSSQKRKEIEDLLKEYKDVFVWSYDDLNVYKGDIIQHTIPLKVDAKHFQHKLRHINPKLVPVGHAVLDIILRRI